MRNDENSKKQSASIGRRRHRRFIACYVKYVSCIFYPVNTKTNDKSNGVIQAIPSKKNCSEKQK